MATVTNANPTQSNAAPVAPARKSTAVGPMAVSLAALIFLALAAWYVAFPHDSGADAALIEATKSGDNAALKTALDNGANPNAQKQISLLQQWMKRDTEESMGYRPLHHAAIRGNTDGVKLLLDKGADVNGRNAVGGTPLMVAAQEAQKDTMLLLLDKGADAKAATKNGKSATDFAVKRNMNAKYQAIVDLLEKRGAPPSLGPK